MIILDECCDKLISYFRSCSSHLASCEHLAIQQDSCDACNVFSYRYLKPWFGIGIGFGLISMTLSVFVVSVSLNILSFLSFEDLLLSYVWDVRHIPWLTLIYFCHCSDAFTGAKFIF